MGLHLHNCLALKSSPIDGLSLIRYRRVDATMLCESEEAFMRDGIAIFTNCSENTVVYRWVSRVIEADVKPAAICSCTLIIVKAPTGCVRPHF